MAWRCAWVVLVVLLAGCKQPEEASVPSTSFIFDETFAGRFGLDRDTAQQMPSGVQAVHVTASQYLGVKFCSWRFYLDEDQIADWPAGEGYRADLEQRSQEGFLKPFADRYANPAFAIHQNDLFNYRLLLSNGDEYTTAIIDRYKKRLVPGTAALAFRIPCARLLSEPVMIYLFQGSKASDQRMVQLIRAPEKAESLGFAGYALPKGIIPLIE